MASVIAAVLVAALASGVASSTGASTKPQPPPWALHGRYSPSIDSANFVAAIDNPDFPVKPGTAFHYRGVKGKTPQTDDMVVTRQTQAGSWSQVHGRP
jgi:hypothetical protein